MVEFRGTLVAEEVQNGLIGLNFLFIALMAEMLVTGTWFLNIFAFG